MAPIGIIRDKMNMARILALRATQYVQALYVQDFVEAGVPKETPLPLSAIGAFQVLSFTGFYTCLRQKVLSTSLEDIGVCPLRFQLKAGASQFTMFGARVPMNLLLSPGRVRVDPADTQLMNGLTLATADLGPAPGQYLQPKEYLFPFRANDTISVDVLNDFDLASYGWRNRWGICFYGIRCTDLAAAEKEAKQIESRK